MAKRNKKKNKQQKQVAPPEFNEVLVGGSSAMGLAFSDKSMEATPKNIKEWGKLLRDGQVASTWQQRELAVIAVDWEVVPGGEDPRDIEAADFLREQLSNVGFDQAFSKMNYGQFYGYSVAECIWGQSENRITLDKIKVRSRERFKFDQKTGEIFFTGGGNPTGDPLPENKMWIYSLPGDSDDVPHGPPLGWKLYWPVFLKENGAKFWAVALEKFGMPTAKGSYPQGTVKEEQDKYLETLLSIHGSGAVAVPEGFIVELMQAHKSAGGDYQAFQSYWDNLIAKIILSQTMTTEDGSSKSQATVHLGVRDEVVQSDADLVCDSFNRGPAVWLTDWNFPGAAYPKVWRKISQAEDLLKRSERDKNVAEFSGLRPKKEYVEETYGGQWEEVTQPVSRMKNSHSEPAFADPDNQDEIESLADKVGDLTDPAMSDMIDQVKDIMSSSTDLDDFQRRLLAFADKIDDEPIAKMLTGGLAVADLSGRATVIDGTSGT